MASHGLQDKGLIISHWNVSFLPRDLSRDTSFMGAWFTYIQSALLREVHGLCFRSLSDVNEDFFPPSSLFQGGAGMVDFYGIKKPAYYAFQFFTRLGQIVLEQADNYIITRSERGYQILLFYLSYFDSLYRLSDPSALSYLQRYNIFEATEHLQVHLLLTLEPGQYSVKKSRLGRQSGSAFDLWLGMGAPENPSPSVIDYIRNKSIPDILYTSEEVSENMVIDTALEPHDVLLIEIDRLI
jgi:xylan 1,4-beta-xylosidase